MSGRSILRSIPIRATPNGGGSDLRRSVESSSAASSFADSMFGDDLAFEAKTASSASVALSISNTDVDGMPDFFGEDNDLDVSIPMYSNKLTTRGPVLNTSVRQVAHLLEHSKIFADGPAPLAGSPSPQESAAASDVLPVEGTKRRPVAAAKPTGTQTPASVTPPPQPTSPTPPGGPQVKLAAHPASFACAHLTAIARSGMLNAASGSNGGGSVCGRSGSVTSSGSATETLPARAVAEAGEPAPGSASEIGMGRPARRAFNTGVTQSDVDDLPDLL